ncbi:MAG: hypothetical protein ACKVY0_22195 [Prosthecobacter sp.]|uniref:hypothetical protein n=1 Tax=Prosthecobacter sp. TaxID=1965333 RepID=UPI0039015266
MYAHVTPGFFGRPSTTVKQARQWWFDPVLWRIPQFFEEAEISEDGSFLLTFNHLVNRWPTRYDPVIWMFWNDSSETKILLGELVGDFHAFKTLMPVMQWTIKSWGYVLVPLDGHWITVETCEGKRFQIHAKTHQKRKLPPH